MIRRLPKTFLAVSILLTGTMLFTLGCGRPENVLRIATTTSLRDSGLLDQLLPIFEKRNNCRVDVVAVGTGAAIKLGEAGDVDAILVHAEEAELAFMQAGHGVQRHAVMVNYFTILGPQIDTAGLKDKTAEHALKTIANKNAVFISRGDDSGTHKRELAIWKLTGSAPAFENYLESGQGMGPSLIIAEEKQGYILSDMGTYLRMKEKLTLVPLLGESDSLRNPYGAITVNPEKNAKINAPLANKFLHFLIADETQQAIAAYTVEGEALFRPLQIDPK
ncbi:MAG: tungstate transport system substrate-binding protein [Pirellulaceae bacterium]|jgi:tungstate transport system substrate-binding protein